MSRPPQVQDRGRREPSGPERGSETKLSYPLPRQTVWAWWKHRGRPVQNPSLIFARFAPDWSLRPTLKKNGLDEVCQAAKNVDRDLVRAWNDRWERVVGAAGAVPFALATDWRLVTGLGAHGPLEVGFTFHRYGLPILPGSGIKGLARMVGLVAVAEALGTRLLGELEDVLSLDDEPTFEKTFAIRHPAAVPAAVELARQFRAVFGTMGAAGGAVFFDAIPAAPPALDLDIMNPHYPKYYQGDEPPAGWQSPVPVYFLTVAPGTMFRFAVGWRRQRDATWQSLREQAEAWLREGLLELGAGGRTGAGYGYFALPAAAPEAGAPAPAGTAASIRPDPPVLEGPAPGPPAEPVQQRRGTIVDMQPTRRFGRVRDSETGQEHRFTMSELEGGQTPAKREVVEFHLQGGRVVLVRRLR